MNADEIDPNVLLAAVTECIADGMANRDADVIPLPERELFRVQPVKRAWVTMAHGWRGCRGRLRFLVAVVPVVVVVLVVAWATGRSTGQS